VALPDYAKIRAAAKELSLTGLVEKDRVSRAQCSQWRIRAAQEEERGEDSSESRSNEIGWCKMADIYAAELAARREAQPKETQEVENTVDAERREQRRESDEEVRTIESETSFWGGLSRRFGNASDIALGFVGLGPNQSAGERASGLLRLFLIAVAIFVVTYLLYRAGRVGLGQLQKAQRLTDSAAQRYLTGGGVI